MYINIKPHYKCNPAKGGSVGTRTTPTHAQSLWVSVVFVFKKSGTIISDSKCPIKEEFGGGSGGERLTYPYDPHPAGNKEDLVDFLENTFAPTPALKINIVCDTDYLTVVKT